MPAQWRDRFGYTPLLAESFTDPEAHAGTCYKASNWEAVGYSRHRADFYLPSDRPKRLWLRPACSFCAVGGYAPASHSRRSPDKEAA
nr:Druantia anti-phage system protein DruA [Verrucomicrobium sp. 3C]